MVQVTFKCTRWLDDQVLLNGWAAGGLSEAPQDQFESCSLAINLAAELGYYGLKPAVRPCWPGRACRLPIPQLPSPCCCMTCCS